MEVDQTAVKVDLFLRASGLLTPKYTADGFSMKWLRSIRSGITFKSKSGVSASVFLICSLSCPVSGVK